MLIHLLQLCILKCQSIILLLINAYVKKKKKKNLYENSNIEGAYFRYNQYFWEKFTQIFLKYLILTIFISDADSYQRVHLKFALYFNSVSLVLIDLHKNQWCPSDNTPLALLWMWITFLKGAVRNLWFSSLRTIVKLWNVVTALIKTHNLISVFKKWYDKQVLLLASYWGCKTVVGFFL